MYDEDTLREEENMKKNVFACVSALSVLLAGCSGTSTNESVETTPSATPVPSVAEGVVWRVSPDEHKFDEYSEVTIMNGMIDQGWEYIEGVYGYPAQWASDGYTGNVLKVKEDGMYTLVDYDGNKLLDDSYAYIGNPFYAGVWIGEDSPVGPYDFSTIYASKTVPWNIGAVEGDFEETIDLVVLNEDFSEGASYMDASQMSGHGGPYYNYFVREGQIYIEYLHGVIEPMDWLEHQIVNRDYVVRVEDASRNVLGYTLVRNHMDIGPTFAYVPVGIPVNGIVAVRDGMPAMVGKEGNFVRDVTNEMVDSGIMAEGTNLGLYDAYNGKLLSDFVYEAVGASEEDYVPVKKNGKWGLLSLKDNTPVIDCIMNTVSSMYDGCVYVDYEGQKGVIDVEETVAGGVVVNAETLSA